jgi:hypothetical protein
MEHTSASQRTSWSCPTCGTNLYTRIFRKDMESGPTLINIEFRVGQRVGKLGQTGQRYRHVRARAAVSFLDADRPLEMLSRGRFGGCALYGRVNYFGIARAATRDNIGTEMSADAGRLSAKLRVPSAPRTSSRPTRIKPMAVLRRCGCVWSASPRKPAVCIA